MSSLARSSSPLPPGGDPFEGTPYRWLRRVGGGGMGEVHSVEHRGLSVDFIAKVPRPEFGSHRQLMERIRLEAQSAARVEHPNVVQVNHLGYLRDGRPYLIMDALSGHTLESEVQSRGRLPLLEALRYGQELASALAAAHAFGIVHRDIKPDNLFLHHEHDGTKTLKVLDFGCVRILPGISADAPIPLAVPTDTGIVVGTPRYVSPEAAIGRRVDHRADIYGAGLVLYFMLTGQGPFDHVRGERAVLGAHVNQLPAPLSSHRVAEATPELEEVIRRVLAKNPDDRLQTANELEAALSIVQQRLSIADERQRAAPRTTPQPAPAPVGDAIEHAATRHAPAIEPMRTPNPVMHAVPILQPPVKRSATILVALFLVLTTVVGLASAGAVSVIRQMAGGQ
jgi:serine/threonine-protein kinase